MTKRKYPHRLKLRSIVMLVFVFLGSSYLSGAERDLVLDPLQPGPYAVGSMNFEISAAALNQILSQGRDAGQYSRGANLGGELLYINSLLENPDAALNFTLSVPDDSTLYGDSAGTTIPLSAFVLYPTTQTNSRANYTVFTDPTLPHMQLAGDSPIFADASARYPLVVYSHGINDHPNDIGFTRLTDLVSHGYIVLALYHGDGRWGELEGRRLNLRPLSVKAALDELLSHPDFVDHIDADKIGGLGESFGGATLLALLGAKVVNPDFASIAGNILLELQTDARIKAAATIVPYMGAGLYTLFGRDGSGATGVTAPFLANAGTEDTVAEYDDVQAVFNVLTGTRYLVEYPETHDFSDGANVDAWTWMKLFMDAKVSGDAEAIENLSRIQSVGDTGMDSLVIAEEAAPVSMPTAEASTFVDNILTIPSLVVQGQTYTVSLSLQGATEPYTFGLVSATPVTAVDIVSATFDESTGMLDLPKVQVGSVTYSIDLQLSNQDPVTFTLFAAEQL